MPRSSDTFPVVRPVSHVAKARMSSTLRRYTHLPAAIHMLRRRTLTLLDPFDWDDNNDSFYIDEYKRRKRLGTALAVCLSGAEETYHHWKVFAGHPSGVCIRFHAASFMKALKKVPGVRVGRLEYRDFTGAARKPLPVDKYPFVKRAAFMDEQEVRVLYESAQESLHLFDVPLPLHCIEQVTLSPWLPQGLVESTADLLHAIEGCEGLEVIRSTIINSEEWKAFARRGADG